LQALLATTATTALLSARLSTHPLPLYCLLLLRHQQRLPHGSNLTGSHANALLHPLHLPLHLHHLLLGGGCLLLRLSSCGLVQGLHSIELLL
jgi:hypothetical protein